MKIRSDLIVFLLTLSAFALSNGALAGENLIKNGDFEDPDDPLKGWCIDWAWEGNANHANNQKCISIVKADGPKKNVMRMGSNLKEPIFMSPLAKFTYGKKYKITFDCRGTENGEGLRVYIRGFKWKSGIKPFENPHWGDLQMIYRQGTVIACTGGPQVNKEIYSRIKNTWTTVSFEFPPVDKKGGIASKSLQPMRYFCIYGVYAGGYFPPDKSEFLIDNLVIEEVK